MPKLPIPFARWTTYQGHSGVDFPQSSGTPFKASGNGVVDAIGVSPRAGHTVWVTYDAEYGSPRVGYVHMNSRTPYVYVGQRVSEGTVLGLVGYGGHVVPPGPAGAHLHAEVQGHATSAGFWKFFDPNRVVGDGSSSGGGSGGWSDDVLNADDKDWIRLCIRQEIEQRLKDGPNLALNDKDWSRLMVQQELAADK